MEQKKRPRLTQEIRDIFNACPGITAKEVVAKLAEKGLFATEGLVESVKVMMKKKSKCLTEPTTSTP